MVGNNYIWIFGENLGKTANNNSFYFWKYAVNMKDDVDKYIVLEKNEETFKVYSTLSNHEKKFVLWRNSLNHFRKYFNADLFFVTLSFKDVLPDELFAKKINFILKKPFIYLQHGTIGMKAIGYQGNSYNNNFLRFFIFSSGEFDYLQEYNKFRSYQLYNAKYHCRYGELLRKNLEYINKNQILWFLTWREYFGDNLPTRLFVGYIKRILKSEQLREYLINEGKTLKLCVHQFFEEEIFKDCYQYVQEGLIEVVRQKDTDVMDELAKSFLLITDYSSVAYDFTFLNKPVILYQPDIEAYMKKRNFYCELDDFEKVNVKSADDLIELIVNNKYSINPFFKKAFPEEIDYNYIKNDNHIKDIYNYFHQLQINKITFLGFNFFEKTTENEGIMALAESLMEQGYYVEMLSLYKPIKSFGNVPFGLNMRYLFWEKFRSIKDKINISIHNSQANYSFLKYDNYENIVPPYVGYELNGLMKKIKSNTVISTSYSLHLFLNKSSSEKIKNKLYLLNTRVLENNNFKKIPLNKNEEKILLFNENLLQVNDKLDYHKKDYVIINNFITKENLLPINEISCIEKKVFYMGVIFLNRDTLNKQNLNNIVEFGCYLKENRFREIIIDVYSEGEYSNELLNLLEKNGILGIINYHGNFKGYFKEIRCHDFVLDLSSNNTDYLIHIGGILNGKKVFSYKNPASLKSLDSIPNSYIKSFEWLCNEILNLYEISLDELLTNYLTIFNKFNSKKSSELLIAQLK